MNLTEELDRLIKEPMHDEDIIHDRVFWKAIDICLEMAKRIEALEQREYSHPLGVGSYIQRRSDV